MHILERYATSCGVKIDRPVIYEKFFPIGVDNYIVLQSASKPSKTYDYWPEVLNIVGKQLNKKRIQIIQIGDGSETSINGAINLLGKTCVNQAAYIIKRSLGVITVDSFSAHIASSYNKKIVVLYSNSNSANVYPYWSDPNDIALIDSPKTGKPSYSYLEDPKTINKIPPEDVAKEICRLFDLEYTFKYKTVNIGDFYSSKFVEMVPNSVVDPSSINIKKIIVRMDLEFNETILMAQLSKCNCVIVTNKRINVEILKNFKNQIVEMYYEVDDNFSLDFLKDLYESGINFLMFSYLDQSKIDSLKFDVMDYGLIVKKELKGISKDFLKDKFYRSSKFTLSNGEIFGSVADFKADIPISNMDNQIMEIPIDFYDHFIREVDNFSILEQTI